MQILINFPTNLGDTILCLPVLDRIKANYPEATVTAFASPHTKSFLLQNTAIDQIAVFDKHWNLRTKLRFVLDLRGKYDFIADLKNSFLPVLLGIKQHTTFIRRFPEDTHKKEIYLQLIRPFAPKPTRNHTDFIPLPEQQRRWDHLRLKSPLFIACSSRSHLKQYPPPLLKKVLKNVDKKHSLVLIGGKNDLPFYHDILTLPRVVNLVGQTNMEDVFYLLKKYAKLLVCVDSSILHIASYLDLPVVALFGPTSPQKFGPYSSKSIVLTRRDLLCVPCQESQCENEEECMNIEPKKVAGAITHLLTE